MHEFGGDIWEVLRKFLGNIVEILKKSREFSYNFRDNFEKLCSLKFHSMTSVLWKNFKIWGKFNFIPPTNFEDI